MVFEIGTSCGKCSFVGVRESVLWIVLLEVGKGSRYCRRAESVE